MEVKDVVKMAIKYVIEIFEDDNITNVGLEEVTFNEADKNWRVVVGFSRPWDYPQPSVLGNIRPQEQPKRHYKEVIVDDSSGKIEAITIRE